MRQGTSNSLPPLDILKRKFLAADISFSSSLPSFVRSLVRSFNKTNVVDAVVVVFYYIPADLNHADLSASTTAAAAVELSSTTEQSFVCSLVRAFF